jgi:exopolysaccharide biosynthesis polyprenyl glycosylphosphotransferase
MPTSTISDQYALEPSAITQRVQNAADRMSPRNQWNAYIVALLANDVLMLLFAYGFSYWIRFGLDLPVFMPDADPSFRPYAIAVITLIPFWLVALKVYELYDKRSLLGGTREYSRVFHVSILGLIVLLMIDFLLTDLVLARGWLLMAWLFSFFFVASGRFWLRRLVYTLRRRGFFTSNALVIGANEEGFALAEQLSLWQTSGLNLLGFVDDTLDVGKQAGSGLTNLGKIYQLDEIITRYNVEELILAPSELPHESLVSIFKRYGTGTNVTIRLSSGLFGLVTNGLEVSQMAFVPLIRVNQMRFTGVENLLKLGLDYSITLSILLLGWPLFAAIALAVKLDSPGGVIHRRTVMGLNGTRFEAYKFRTMYENGDDILEEYPELKKELEKNHKLKNDPRITRTGKFLRQYSLDELPQLFNVIKRDMSLVGPRMISPQEMDRFGKWGTNLLTVKPGLTGLWQVSGRSDTTYDERVQLDMYYIRNWTILSDIYLLWKTIPAVIKKHGAY